MTRKDLLQKVAHRTQQKYIQRVNTALAAAIRVNGITEADIQASHGAGDERWKTLRTDFSGLSRFELEAFGAVLGVKGSHLVLGTMGGWLYEATVPALFKLLDRISPKQR